MIVYGFRLGVRVGALVWDILLGLLAVLVGLCVTSVSMEKERDIHEHDPLIP